MPAQIKDKKLVKLGLELKFLDDLYLSFGILGKDGKLKYETGINLATVALYNEFGTNPEGDHPGNPARSFLRGTLSSKKQEIANTTIREFKKVVVEGKNPVSALSVVGEYVAAQVRTRIATSYLWAAPNKSSTIKNKGNSWPLHDTLKLANKISWQIRRGGPQGRVIKTGKSNG